MMKRNLLSRTLLLLLMVVGGVCGAWAQTLTEGFENKATGTNYQGTVTVSEEESDCGIGWEIYYGCVSTNDKVSDGNNAQMRWYASAIDKYPYVMTTTAIEGLSNVALKARTSSTNVKMDISYSADGENWTVGTTYTFETTKAEVSFDIPVGNKFVKFGVSTSSTAPTSGNYKLGIDDVVFTYSSSKTATTTTIDASGITNTYINEGTAAGSLSATVKAGEAVVSGAAITWLSSKEEVATIDEDGVVTLVGEGTTTITARFAGDDKYNQSSDTYDLTVTDTRSEAGLAFEENSYTLDEGDELSAPALTNPNNLTVTYESSAPSVATVDADGNVTAVAAGSATITASFAGNSSYKAGSASYSVIVKMAIPADAILYESFDTNEKVGGNDGTWSAIQQTPAPSFDNEGWEYETAYAGYQCVRTGKSGSITTPALGITGDVTLSFMMASWGSDTNNGYVTILNGGTFDDGESTQKTISIKKSEWGTFTLDLKNVTAETKIKFFDNGNGKRLFIDEVLIVKPSVKIAVAKDYISFCSDKALDFTNVEGLEALVVTKVNETSVSTEAVTTVPARVGVILHKTGTATSFNVPVAATATAPATNYLVGVLEATTIGGNDTDYVLKDGVFKKANAGTLAAGKAYLKTDANAAPALTIGYGDEGTTGIRSIDNGQLTIDNVYYDLSGRRVAEPTKGVYIVNGKKVVIK